MLTWDENKNASNLQKHGYSFEDVEAIFDYPVVSWDDNRHSYGERRINLLGWLHGRVMHFTYTDDGMTVRAISLREATKHEIRRYRKALSK